MKLTNRIKAWFAVSGIALLTLTLGLAGCGGSGSTTAPTETTASGTVSSTSGTVVSEATVTSPTEVAMSIPAGTVLTDSDGNAVSGEITTKVSYSATTADLTAKTGSLPNGTTLAAFVDIDMGAVKTFSSPLALKIKVPASIAASGDALVVYSYSSGAWKFEGTEIVGADGSISPTVKHLSVWGLFKSSATPPVKPSGVTVAGGTGRATVSWSEVSGATSYNVYYGTESGVTTASINKATGITTTSQTVTGLLNGSTYYFVVTAVNAAGESVVSGEVAATPIARPSGTTVTAGDGQATVSWVAVTGATSYNIYYGTTAGVTTSTGTKIANVTTPQVVSGLTNGTTYYFVVTALNTSGESVVSSEDPVTPSPTLQAPPSPTGVRLPASPATSPITVSWNAVPGATSYNVYYLQSATAPTTATVMATGTKLSSATASQSIDGLASGVSYYVAVTAVNTAGESGAQEAPKKVTIQ